MTFLSTISSWWHVVVGLVCGNWRRYYVRRCYSTTIVIITFINLHHYIAIVNIDRSIYDACIHTSIHLFIYHIYVYLPTYLSYLSIHLSIHLSFILTVYIHLSIITIYHFYLHIHPSIHPSIYSLCISPHSSCHRQWEPGTKRDRLHDYLREKSYTIHRVKGSDDDDDRWWWR